MLLAARRSFERGVRGSFRHRALAVLGTLVLLCSGLVVLASPAQATTLTYEYTGSAQLWLVPPGVTSATFSVYGAQGGEGVDGGGGLGGFVSATIPVTAGEVLVLNVAGAAGSFDGDPHFGGFPDGATGGSGFGALGYGGGGASAVLRDGLRLLIAGGGGGRGGGGNGGAGAAGVGGGQGGSGTQVLRAGGGGLSGFNGTGGDGGTPGRRDVDNFGFHGESMPDLSCNPPPFSSCGQGGTGGAGGQDDANGAGDSGGGGGGGYGGGGGGGAGPGGGGGGGGGGGYGPTGTVYESAVRFGDGRIDVTYSATTATPTTTSLTSSVNPSAYGQSVSFTATVTPGACDQGTVTFKDAATVLSSTTTNSAGVASLATGSLSTGTHPITASFTPSDTTNCLGSTSSTVQQLVTKAPTVTTLTANPSAAQFGQSVTFAAHVAPNSANPVLPPTGTVSFYLNGASTPIATLPLNSNGNAAFSTAGLGAGHNTMVAVYSGDPNFKPSSSNPFTVTVGGTGGTYTITGNYTGTIVVAAGQTVTIGNATVTGTVVVQAGGSLDVENSSISGSIYADKAGPIRICGSRASGGVTVTNASSWVLVGDPADGCLPNTIGGSLTLLHNHHGVQVINNTVTGAVTATDNAGTGPFPNDTTPRITGNHR